MHGSLMLTPIAFTKSRLVNYVYTNIPVKGEEFPSLAAESRAKPQLLQKRGTQLLFIISRIAISSPLKLHNTSNINILNLCKGKKKVEPQAID